MKRLSDFLKYLSYSISLFALSSSLVSLSLWLDMRLHSAYLVYISFFLVGIIFLISDLKVIKDLKVLILADLILCLVIGLGKFDRISYELRDAFKLPLKIASFKSILLLIFLLANLTGLYYYLKSKK